MKNNRYEKRGYRDWGNKLTSKTETWQNEQKIKPMNRLESLKADITDIKESSQVITVHAEGKIRSWGNKEKRTDKGTKTLPISIISDFNNWNRKNI